jgi:splicing factor U2AF subunit
MSMSDRYIASHDRDNNRDRDRDRGRERPRDHDRGHSSRDRSGSPRSRSRDRYHHGDNGRSRERERRSRSGSRSRSPSFISRRLERRRRYKTLWDKPPTAEQQRAEILAQQQGAKGPNSFNQYSHQNVVSAAHNQQGQSMNPLNKAAQNNSSIALAIQQYPNRQARRVYVGNIPTGIAEFELRSFFNTEFVRNFSQFAQPNGADSVISAYIGQGKG